MNRGMTAAYSEAGSWRGPKTLKYRRPTVSTPYRRDHTRAYISVVAFESAYGEIGAGGCSSHFGSGGSSPYTDDDEAYTTRRTPARRAASSTVRVPLTLWSLAPSGSSTERGTDRMAA